MLLANCTVAKHIHQVRHRRRSSWNFGQTQAFGTWRVVLHCGSVRRPGSKAQTRSHPRSLFSTLALSGGFLTRPCSCLCCLLAMVGDRGECFVSVDVDAACVSFLLTSSSTFRTAPCSVATPALRSQISSRSARQNFLFRRCTPRITLVAVSLFHTSTAHHACRLVLISHSVRTCCANLGQCSHNTRMKPLPWFVAPSRGLVGIERRLTKRAWIGNGRWMDCRSRRRSGSSSSPSPTR